MNIKAVQLDLARQMESVDFIKKYIAFAAQNGFNTVFLYLEWRIRCNAVDLGEGSGYTKDELKDIVDFARQCNIDIIPGLAALGHSELLIAQDKFAHLAELFPDLNGRFGVHTSHTLCPSKNEVRKLLANYFTEAAEIFPSPYFHIGGDEAWDIKFCKECKKRNESEAELFAGHFIFCHRLVTSLNKRMMMWDDMFEFYPQILPAMPRDIIMVNWQYQENVSAFQGHFSNLAFEDLHRKYDRLGFDYIFAPAEYTWGNIESITKYGKSAKPLGFLLTVWEKAQSLLYRSLPNIALAGRLWSSRNQTADSAFKDIAEDIFGIDDEIFANALQSSQNNICRMQQHVTLAEGNLLTHSYSGLDTFLLPSLELQKNTLTKYAGKLKDDFAELILSDILDICELKIQKLRTIQIFSDILNGFEHENPFELLPELHKIRDRQLALCSKVRRPGDLERMNKLFTDWENAVKNTYGKLQNSNQLKILFSLKDVYGAQQTGIYAKINGEYRYLAGGCFKCGSDYLFYRTILLDKDFDTDTLKIESNGFGGVGICYAELKINGKNFIPEKVLETSGEISDLQHILYNDAAPCFLGHTRIQDIFTDKTASAKIHSITLKFKSAD